MEVVGFGVGLVLVVFKVYYEFSVYIDFVKNVDFEIELFIW